MEFVVNGETQRGAVTNRSIEKSIRSLTGEGDSFAILARDSEVYIQTSGGPDHGFVLEYRNGSADEHYSCSNFELTADEVIRAFQGYLADDDQWKTGLEWQPQVFNYTSGSSNGGISAAVVAFVVVAVAAYVAWYLFLSP